MTNLNLKGKDDMEIALLSSTFTVRKLNAKDIGLIYDLCSKNEIFYQYHPPSATKESILEDMAALPPGKDYKDKFFIGFWETGTLVAIMDLILGYPAEDIAFIGLSMMNLDYQGQGIGSKIMMECTRYLQIARLS